MSSPFDYQHPHDNASIPDDSGSDDDLDLEELDPDTVSDHQPPRFSENNTRSQGGYAPAIALRKLRVGVENRLRRKVSGRGSEEDMNGLLENQGDRVRRSQASSHNPHDDDAPLLHEGRRSSARSLRDERPTLKHRLRSWFPRFGGITSRVSRNEPENVPSKPPREVLVAQPQRSKYPPNIVSNAKYTPWSFLPRTLYNEFSFFFNIYFLLVALSQIIPVLRIGYMSSYIAPLVFVISISLGKEALDDIGRRRRDAEANSEQFSVLSLDQSLNRRIVNAPGSSGSDNEHVLEVTKRSRDLKVGDILKIRKNQRLPADVVILKSVSSDSTHDDSTVETSTDLIDSNQVPSAEPEPSSTATSRDKDSSPADTFIRTDQLDGETDWKLRLPSPLSQTLPAHELSRLKVTASAPDQKVNEFVGAIKLEPPSGFYDEHVDKSQSGREDTDGDSQNNSAPLTIDNTAWANTVLASNTITYAVIIYTGSQTRAALSTSPSRSKVGLLEHEINSLTKILCVLTLALSVILVALEKFHPTSDKPWYVAIMIYLILFSTIIPMSLRVNLDMAKSVYGRFIERDNDIPETVVRTSTIPEDLGRIEYLLSDKTGTLTQNGECALLRCPIFN